MKFTMKVIYNKYSNTIALYCPIVQFIITQYGGYYLTRKAMKRSYIFIGWLNK